MSNWGRNSDERKRPRFTGDDALWGTSGSPRITRKRRAIGAFLVVILAGAIALVSLQSCGSRKRAPDRVRATAHSD